MIVMDDNPICWYVDDSDLMWWYDSDNDWYYSACNPGDIEAKWLRHVETWTLQFHFLKCWRKLPLYCKESKVFSCTGSCRIQRSCLSFWCFQLQLNTAGRGELRLRAVIYSDASLRSSIQIETPLARQMSKRKTLQADCSWLVYLTTVCCDNRLSRSFFAGHTCADLPRQWIQWAGTNWT